jgi:hypothetical protein
MVTTFRTVNPAGERSTTSALASAGRRTRAMTTSLDIGTS